MSIYVGDKKFDLHYTTTGNKVNRSVFKGENKLWPLYEFSFYDGSMQKNIENIPASGQNESIEIRTCEDSWWHKLKFDEVYVFDKAAANSWLRYNATKLNCANTKYHWLSIKPGTNYSFTPSNSDSVQTVSFSDNYNESHNHISNIDNSGGTCKENSYDINMLYEIDKNEWFTDRSGYMYGKQYDEWDHISGASRYNYHFYDLSPSDNTPIIYISQESNSWGSNSQQIEFSCTPYETPAVGGSVKLTWKIYSNTTSGSTIYYGSNIASNNATKELSGEIYGDGYMWITASNPNIELNTGSVEKSISSDGVVTWTMTATWGSNEAKGNNASHSISFNGFPSSVSTSGGSYTVSATCTQVSVDRNNTFTLNVGSRNNWRPGSATCKCMQKGETRTEACCVSTSSSFSSCNTSVTISFDSVSAGDKTYYLSVSTSSIKDSGSFTVTSYYSQSSSSGGSATVYAKCPDSGKITSRSVSQDSMSGGSGGVGFSVSCTGDETISPSSVSSSELSGYSKTISVDAHSSSSSGDGTITVTQYESGKTATITHVYEPVDPAFSETFSYRITLFDNSSDASNESVTSGTSNITIGSSTTSTTVYARLEEKCKVTTSAGIAPNGDPNTAKTSYDYIVIKSSAVSRSGVTLNDFTSFSFSGGNDVNGNSNWHESGSISVSSSYISLSISGTSNSDKDNDNKYCEMEMVSDNVSTITACDNNSDAFSFTFSLNEITNNGGYNRTGKFTASFNGAYASCNWSQTSSVESSSSTSPITGKSSSISVSLSNGNFAENGISESSNGRYTVKVKTLSDFYGNYNAQFVEGMPGDYDMSLASGIMQDYTLSSSTSSVKFGVTVTGTKYFTQYKDGSNILSSRTVTATASYSYNGETETVTTSQKTQNVCLVKDSTTGEITSPGVTWTDSEKAPTLYSDYNPKNGASTTVSIVNTTSGNTTATKTIYFYATLDADTSKQITFSITWPKATTVETSWKYTVEISIEISNDCSNTSYYISINGEKKGSDVSVSPGGSNTITYESESITTNSTSATVALYKSTGEVAADYGTQTFTPTSNKLTKTYTENCTPVIPNYIISIDETSYTTCPGSTLNIQFTIRDDDYNYYNINDISNSHISLSDDGWTLSNINYSNNVNSFTVKSSNIDGDEGKVEICVANDKFAYITITNKTQYICGGIKKS